MRRAFAISALHVGGHGGHEGRRQPAWRGQVSSLAPTSPQGRRLAPDETAFWSARTAEVREKLTYDANINRTRFATKDHRS